MSAAKFYSMRSCNDDYVPLPRSTCEFNDWEKKNFSNENRACISQYSDANIQFREVKVVIPWLDLDETDARFQPDARLEALDAKLEAICADYEKRLNGSEDDIIRPDFDSDDDIEQMKYREDREYKRFCQMNSFHEEEEYLIYDDSGEMTPRGKVVTYNEFCESMLGKAGYNDGDVAPRGKKLKLEVPVEVCSECGYEGDLVAYGWRHVDDNLCIDCVNLPGMDAYEC